MQNILCNTCYATYVIDNLLSIKVAKFIKNFLKNLFTIMRKCAIISRTLKGGIKMKDYREYLEPGVKESFDSAVKALNEKLGEAVATIADMKVKESLVESKMASYMYGYFTAMAEAFPDCSKVFYTAATNMIHFRYYNYNGEEYDYD